MTNLSPIKIVQNFIGSFSPSTFFKSLTPLQRKVGVIALGAIACFVAFYLACRSSLKEKKEEIANQPAAPQPTPKEEPKILPHQQALDTDEIEPESPDLIQTEKLETVLKPIPHALNFFKKYLTLFFYRTDLNIAELKSKLDLDSDNPQLMFDYGEAHRHHNLHTEACDIFKKALTLVPKHPFVSRRNFLQTSILLSHGESLLMLEKYEDAISLFKQAEQLNHYLLHDITLCYHGFALQFQGKEKEAINKLEEAVKTLDPQCFDYNNSKAFVLRKYILLLCLQNKPQQAIEKFQAALEIDNQRTEVLYLYGEALRMQGKDKEALEKFEAALTPAQFAEIKQEMENAAKT